MKRLVRATFLSATLAVLAGHASLASAQTTPPADAWPQRPVRMVVPFPPGGGTDVVTRALAQKLAGRLGTAVLLIRQALFVNLARAEVSKPLDGLKLNGIGTLQ